MFSQVLPDVPSPFLFSLLSGGPHPLNGAGFQSQDFSLLGLLVWVEPDLALHETHQTVS